MVEDSMSEKEELIFMQPYGETEPRWVKVFDLLPENAPLVSEEKRKHRYDICKSCDMFQNHRCNACGCFMPQKTWTIDSTCPLQKWD